MRWSEGFLTLGRLSGVPVRVHWTLPLGALFLSGFTFSPGFWVGFALLILAHEMGHAALVKACGGSVTEVRLHGIGGECRFYGIHSELHEAIIAWGGVLAQAVVLLLAYLYRTFVPVSSLFVAQLLSVWVQSNLMLMAINLLPIAPLDGSIAWRLPRLLRARRARQASAPKKAERPRLRLIQGQKSDVMSSPSANDDEPLPPVPEELKREIERITREALRGSKNDKN